MATPRKEEHEKKHRVEEIRIMEYREWKESRLQEMERGTLQQQRLAALDRSRAWDFTPEEEVEFMLTPSGLSFETYSTDLKITLPEEPRPTYYDVDKNLFFENLDNLPNGHKLVLDMEVA